MPTPIRDQMAPDRSGPAPGIAHFRPHWYLPTETFLFNLVQSARATRPLLVGFERSHADAFPHAGPILTLYPPGGLAALARRARLRFGGPERDPGFSARRITGWLAQHDAQLLHAHFGDTGVSLLPLQRATGLPLVTSFYGHDASRLARIPAWREKFLQLFAACDALLVEGPHLGETLRALGCPTEKLHIQRIAIDVARYRFRTRQAPEDGRPARLFFCARFTEKKGLPVALEALARVADHPLAPRLRIGGDGPQRAEIDAQIERLGIAERVELLGMLSHEAMCRELEACDLFLQPSQTAADGDSEGGAPTTLIEAQACGVPVLSTTHADVPNVVHAGRSALLSPEGDAEAFAANLRSLLDSPERWAEMGRAGREWVDQHHDTAREGERLEKLYLQLIEARSGR